MKVMHCVLFLVVTIESSVYFEPKSKFDAASIKALIKDVYDPIKEHITQERLFGNTEKITPLVNNRIKQNTTSKKIPQATLDLIRRLIMSALTHDIHDYDAASPEYKNLEDKAAFEWCLCGGPEERIFFTIQLVQDALATYNDKKKPLVYTSLGSGWLLHDFLNIQELIQAGYETIFVNIIDVEYPDDMLIPKTARDKIAILEDIEHQKNVQRRKELEAEDGSDSESYQVIPGEQRYLGHPIEAVNIIDKFTLEITKWISLNKKNSSVHVQHFTSAYDYIDQVERKPELKSNIIVLIDPDGPAIYEIPEKEAFPSRANAIMVTVSNEQDPETGDYLYVFLPTKLKPIIWRTARSSEQPCFTQTLKTLLENFPAQTQKVELYTELKEFFEKNCQPKENVDIDWASSAHLALFDIITKTAQPKALIYSMLSTEKERASQSIHQYNPQQPSAKKFIDDTIGLDLIGMEFKEASYRVKEAAYISLLKQTFKDLTSLFFNTKPINPEKYNV